MTALLSVEWLKVRRYRTFWIILGLFAFCALLATYVYNDVMLGNAKVGMLLATDSSFAGVWYNTAYIVSFCVILVALLIVLLAGNEFQFRTHRQNVIDGWSRDQFIHAKWAMVVVLSLSITLFTALLGVTTGLLKGIDFSTIGNGAINLVWVFLLSLVYLGGALFTVTLIRRSGLSLIILLCYYLIVDYVLHAIFKWKLNILFLDFLLPFETADQLMPVPRMGKMAEEFTKYEQLPVWTYALVSLVWVAVFYLGSRTRALRSDW